MVDPARVGTSLAVASAMPQHTPTDPGKPLIHAEPKPKFPAQHLKGTGAEAQLKPRPRYQASRYKAAGKLEGRRALISGGDSGIGRAVAVLYAREGADVAVLYHSHDDDAEETRRAVEAEGRRCLLFKGDVADYAFCERAVRETVTKLGGLDIVVPNAAFQKHAESIEQISLDDFDRTMKTNLYGYFYLLKAAVPHLRAGAAIVMSGSETGLYGSGALLDYATTKGGIHALTKSLAQNLLKKGIRVNCVAPGPVWTPLNPADAGKSKEQIAEFGAQSELGRPAQPEEIAPAYVFLASDADASYCTGQILPVLGGVNG